MRATRTHRASWLDRFVLLAPCLLGGCGTPDLGGSGDPDGGTASSGGVAATGSGAAVAGVGGGAGEGTAGVGAGGGGGVGVGGAAGGDTGAVTCPGPFVLCEDFENDIDANTWTATNGPAIDATRAHRGTHSIHFVTDPGANPPNPGGRLKTTKPFPQLQDDLWGRVFVYMEQTPPGSTDTNLGPNSSFGTQGGGGGILRFGFRHTRFSAGWNYPGFDKTNTDDLVWPLNTWVCVEWHHAGDPAQGTVTQDYWMDGVYRPKMHFDAHVIGPATYFWIGMYLFGSKYDLWMDDLVLDVKQVGCAK